MKRRSLAIILSLLLVLSLAGCGGSYKSANSAASGASFAQSAPATPEAPMEAAEGYWADGAAENFDYKAETEASNGTDNSMPDLPDGVKMIYRANLELETTEFEQADAQIKAITRQLGGYFEEQSARTRSGGYRSASYTVRVPAASFQEFLNQIGNACTVTYQTQSAEDVSEYYYDMESRLETAKIKLDRLQDLLVKAEEMEDIITLEGAISDTEYQIERLSGEKRHYDALIGYSTINVSLNEVYRVTEVETAPLTFGQRIAIAFRDGLRHFGNAAEDFAEWLAYSWLGLLVFALAIYVIVRIIMRIRRGRMLKSGAEKKPRKKLFGRGKQKADEPAVPEKTSDNGLNE